MTHEHIFREQTDSTGQAVSLEPEGYLPLEEVADAESSFTPRPFDTQPWVLCADERAVDDASDEYLLHLYPDTLSPHEGGVSIFGQFMGMAHTVAIALMARAKNSDEALHSLHRHGGIAGIATTLAAKLAEDTSYLSVRPAHHTAIRNEAFALQEALTAGIEVDEQRLVIHSLASSDQEEPKVLFCGHGSAPTGCAYCTNFGKVSAVLATNDGAQDIAADDIHYILGRDSWLEEIVVASSLFCEELPGGSDFSYGREDFVASGLPVLTLANIGHIATAQARVIYNLEPTDLSMPGREYRQDIAAVALAIKRALPDLELDTQLLYEIMIANAVPTRMVLAATDGAMDARRLAIGVRGGDGDESIERVDFLASRY